jgi:hypothetical protein
VLAEKARYHRGKSGNETVRFQEATKTEGYLSSESIVDDEFDFSQGEELSSDTDYVDRSPSQPWAITDVGGVKMERDVLGHVGDLVMGTITHFPCLIVRHIQPL